MNDTGELWKEVRAQGKSLDRHLGECSQNSKQLWIEIRGFKRVLWTAVIGGYSVLGGLLLGLLKLHFGF